MTDTEEATTVELDTNPKKLSIVGGFTGSVLGSRLSRGGAVVGGLVGGTLGYLAGSTDGSPAGTPGTDADPVAIDVAESTEDNDAEAAPSESTDDEDDE